MTARTRLRRSTSAFLSLSLAAVVAAAVPTGVTDASWTDRTRATGGLGSGSWAFDGQATASAVSASVKHVVLLIPDTVGPVGPMQQTVATADDRGPYSETAVSVSVPGLHIVTVTTASVSADAVETTAVYTPARAAATSSILGAHIGLDVLGQNLSGINDLLANFVTVGAVDASVACKADGDTSAQASAPDDLELTLIGQPVQLDAQGKVSLTVGVNLSVSLELYRFLLESDDPEPKAEAEVGLLATATVGYLNVATISIAVPLVHATCDLELP